MGLCRGVCDKVCLFVLPAMIKDAESPWLAKQGGHFSRGLLLFAHRRQFQTLFRVVSAISCPLCWYETIDNRYVDEHWHLSCEFSMAVGVSLEIVRFVGTKVWKEAQRNGTIITKASSDWSRAEVASISSLSPIQS